MYMCVCVNMFVSLRVSASCCFSSPGRFGVVRF